MFVSVAVFPELTGDAWELNAVCFSFFDTFAKCLKSKTRKMSEFLFESGGTFREFCLVIDVKATEVVQEFGRFLH